MTENQLATISKHLTKDEKPSIFLEKIKSSLVNTPLEVLTKLESIEQNPIYHPEGNVWNHMVQVVDVAAKIRELSSDEEVFMMAALLHDLGKILTTKRNKQGRLISYNHDTEGKKMAEEILSYYNVSENKKEKIVNLVRYHMHHIYIMKDLPFGDVEGLKKEVEIRDILLLFISDKLGRNQKDKDKKLKEIEEVKKIIDILIHKYNCEIKDYDKLIEEVVKRI